ncbi:MAG: hypothetical protein AUF79_13945 [Crenarchaeota archaeon 13_1_20CM_2_51_8]|nr:MAG: hypothetical protein AUF79_13945 [Crenarchaeota archaeon 13_1_20CM_2_51_8]
MIGGCRGYQVRKKDWANSGWNLNAASTSQTSPKTILMTVLSFSLFLANQLSRPTWRAVTGVALVRRPVEESNPPVTSYWSCVPEKVLFCALIRLRRRVFVEISYYILGLLFGENLSVGSTNHILNGLRMCLG